MNNLSPSIVVVGSINMDLVARCAALPTPGETLTATDFVQVFGGKGANQAVAASRAGGQISMIGRVGDDSFAQPLLTNLLNDRVNCDGVRRSSHSPSGLALIAVEASGENQILVVPGANGLVSVTDIHQATDQISACDLLLVQLEIPIDAAIEAIAIARSAGVRVVLDPAPVPTGDFPADLLNVDVLCPNETEAAVMTGRNCDSLQEIEAAARDLHQKGAANVAVTLGERGTLLFDGQLVTLIESFEINAADTTGAGDAFAGAFSVHWAQNNNLADAVRFANAAGALAASRMGAQNGMGTRSEIESLLSKHG